MLDQGTPTGCYDTDGVEFKIGDLIRQDVVCNNELHGSWALYQIELRGIVPVYVYVQSERGPILPPGYLGQPLSCLYDGKMFMFSNDRKSLRPEPCTYVLTAEEKAAYRKQLVEEAHLISTMLREANEMFACGTSVKEICSTLFQKYDNTSIKWDRQKYLDIWRGEREAALKTPTCQSCNSEMTLSEDGQWWTCQFCQGEQRPIKVNSK